MSSATGLLLLLAVILNGNLQVLASPVRHLSEHSLANATSALGSSSIAAFWNSCLKTDSSSSTECGNPGELDITLAKLPKLIRNYINENKKENANLHCKRKELRILRSMNLTFSTCNAANNESAQKAIVTLHLVSHFLMNTSTTNPSLSNYLTFYGNINDYLQSLSCLMKCTSGGLNSTHLQTFVLNLKMGKGKDFFQKGDGFLYRRDVDETAFSMYQCQFLKRSMNIMNNLKNYYKICSSL